MIYLNILKKYIAGARLDQGQGGAGGDLSLWSWRRCQAMSRTLSVHLRCQAMSRTLSDEHFGARLFSLPCSSFFFCKRSPVCNSKLQLFMNNPSIRDSMHPILPVPYVLYGINQSLQIKGQTILKHMNELLTKKDIQAMLWTNNISHLSLNRIYHRDSHA